MASQEINQKQEHRISEFSDPFTKEGIKRISFEMYRYNSGRISYEAIISFRSNNTKGEQVIQGNSFEDLQTKAKIFLDSLDQ